VLPIDPFFCIARDAKSAMGIVKSERRSVTRRPPSTRRSTIELSTATSRFDDVDLAQLLALLRRCQSSVPLVEPCYVALEPIFRNAAVRTLRAPNSTGPALAPPPELEASDTGKRSARQGTEILTARRPDGLGGSRLEILPEAVIGSEEPFRLRRSCSVRLPLACRRFRRVPLEAPWLTPHYAGGAMLVC